MYAHLMLAPLLLVAGPGTRERALLSGAPEASAEAEAATPTARSDGVEEQALALKLGSPSGREDAVELQGVS